MSGVEQELSRPEPYITRAGHQCSASICEILLVAKTAAPASSCICTLQIATVRSVNSRIGLLCLQHGNSHISQVYNSLISGEIWQL